MLERATLYSGLSKLSSCQHWGGAVTTKDIESNSLAVWKPAKVIKNPYETIRTIIARRFVDCFVTDWDVVGFVNGKGGVWRPMKSS